MIAAVKRIILLALTACLCLSVVLCGCSGDDQPTGDGLMTAVTDDDGVVTGYERRFHNDNGDITRLDVYDKDKIYQSYVLYAYDDAYRLLSETYYQADGFAMHRYVYTYDDSGKLYEKALEKTNGESIVERYDQQGVVVEKRYYGADEKLVRTETLENGEWVSRSADDSPTES